MGDLESLGGSSTPREDIALAYVGGLMAELQPDSMVQGFVVIVTGIDQGDRHISAFVAPGQKQWETLGMLGFVTAAEINGIGQVTDDEDDD